MPVLIRGLAALGLCFGLADCYSIPGPEVPYPFVGTWDCAGNTLVFTNTSYTFGDQSLPIRSVTSNGRNYDLLFQGGFMIGLAAVTDTGMTWVSGKTGAQQVCRRLSPVF